MCGIAGFYGFRSDNLIKKISKELAHRGPDGEGFYFHDHVTLLNRRLAIIDRKGGDQPIYNEDKSIVVVYNGEIYNYQDLREELEKAGHTFKTKSDTEVIVHGYEEWGEECFNRFNGMFAVALFDLRKNEMVLARDHFGIKPLYYSLIPDVRLQMSDRRSHLPAGEAGMTDEKQESGIRHQASDIRYQTSNIIFSSEIKPIINSELIEKAPNDKVIYRYLAYRVHDDSEETFFKGVYKLMPGEMMVVRRDGIEKKYFSRLKEELIRHSGGEPPSGRGDEDSRMTNQEQEKFRNNLIKAIKLRLISEVPVGTCLSGGLDSSTVVAVVNKLLHEKVKEAESVGKTQNTFSAVFPNSTNNEENYIDELFKRTKQVKSHKVYPKAEEFFTEIEDFIRTQEEPTISTGPYAQYKVMQEARKYVTVLLDGQGADEMMAGYLPYYFVYLKQLQRQGKLLKLIQEIIGAKDIFSKYLFQKLLILLRFKKTVHPKQLLNSEFAEKYKQERFTPVNMNLKERLIEDIFHDSLPSLLRYEDKNSMRFSIEGRVPFLDMYLISSIFSLPDSAIIENGWNKNILRNAVKDLLPYSISRRRNKIGFTTPEYEWFIRMKNRIYSYFLSESFARRKYFSQSAVVKAFEEFIRGKNDDTMLFWRFLNLELWLQIFFDPGTEKKAIKERSIFSQNQGKSLTFEVRGEKYYRFPIKTDVVQKGDELLQKIIKPVESFLSQFIHKSQFQKIKDNEWFLVISEKIVAISQGRSYFIWDINPGFWAKVLSRSVTRTPYGIGLGSPWTMQLAIDEVGLPRILFASVISVFGKVFGIRGLFYRLAGGNVGAIDGPTEYSLYPSNVSAKLPPKDPEKVAKELHEQIAKKLTKGQVKNFKGVVIIDANDLGRNVMGNSTGHTNSFIEKIFNDNPMGQSDEQTPVVIVFG